MSRNREVFVNAGDFDDVPDDLIQRAVARALDHEGVDVAGISVTMLADDAIRAMNREYLSEDRPTDVIAFRLSDAHGVVGDVYVGHDQAVRQAGELGVPVDEELTRLAVHGTLHVLGHDHPEGDDRAESPMYQLQERLLREILADRTPSPPSSRPFPP